MDDPLMKPFLCGWTREVVKRLVIKSKNVNCDIYYFSPSGKKIRSTRDLELNLTDGLTLDCFSFKREPLGLNENYETIRKARAKKNMYKLFDNSSIGCGIDKTNTKKKKKEQFKMTDLKKKTHSNCAASKNRSEIELRREMEVPKINVKNNVRKVNATKGIKNSNSKSVQDFFPDEKFTNGVKSKAMLDIVCIRSEICKPRVVLERLLTREEKNQTVVTDSKGIVKQIMSKKGCPKNKLPIGKIHNKTDLKNQNLKGKINSVSKKANVPLKNHGEKSKLDYAKEESSIKEMDKKLPSRDLRSIVKKNIGKYREMREKQKLAIKSQIKKNKRRISSRNITRRLESTSKNHKLYLKPFERGWRRELVYRKNSSKCQADVYYYHPNGKKLRSRREICMNLTHGLSIEFFTFRKEIIGCGEPHEVVRKARIHSKKSLSKV